MPAISGPPFPSSGPWPSGELVHTLCHINYSLIHGLHYSGNCNDDSLKTMSNSNRNSKQIYDKIYRWLKSNFDDSRVPAYLELGTKSKSFDGFDEAWRAEMNARFDELGIPRLGQDYQIPSRTTQSSAITRSSPGAVKPSNVLLPATEVARPRSCAICSQKKIRCVPSIGGCLACKKAGLKCVTRADFRLDDRNDQTRKPSTQIQRRTMKQNKRYSAAASNQHPKKQPRTLERPLLSSHAAKASANQAISSGASASTARDARPSSIVTTRSLSVSADASIPETRRNNSSHRKLAPQRNTTIQDLEAGPSDLGQPELQGMMLSQFHNVILDTFRQMLQVTIQQDMTKCIATYARDLDTVQRDVKELAVQMQALQEHNVPCIEVMSTLQQRLADQQAQLHDQQAQSQTQTEQLQWYCKQSDWLWYLIETGKSWSKTELQRLRSIRGTLQANNKQDSIQALADDLLAASRSEKRCWEIVNHLLGTHTLSAETKFPMTPLPENINDKWRGLNGEIQGIVASICKGSMPPILQLGIFASRMDVFLSGLMSVEQFQHWYTKGFTGPSDNACIVRSLLSALICRLLFNDEFLFKGMHGDMLRGLYSTFLNVGKKGTLTVRRLDFTATKLCIESKDFQDRKIPLLARSTANQLIGVLATVSRTSVTGEASEDIYNGCKDAVDLKLSLLVSPKEYRVEFYSYGTLFDPKRMDAEKADGSSIFLHSDEPKTVLLCLFPALVQYSRADDEKLDGDIDMLLACNKSFLGETTDTLVTPAEVISKAIVLLE